MCVSVMNVLPLRRQATAPNSGTTYVIRKEGRRSDGKLLHTNLTLFLIQSETASQTKLNYCIISYRSGNTRSIQHLLLWTVGSTEGMYPTTHNLHVGRQILDKQSSVCIMQHKIQEMKMNLLHSISRLVNRTLNKTFYILYACLPSDMLLQ